MIGPVSGTGRAMMSSLQQAMSKGMPADQAIAYVKSMAQQGVAPLVDLYAMMKQFERLKQPPQQMPQGGTIRDQLNALEQGMGQGGGMPQGMPQPMGQGIAGLNAGNMENPQFAGGGIVAFADGDLVEDTIYDPMTGVPISGGATRSGPDMTLRESVGLGNPENRRALEEAERDLRKAKATPAKAEPTAKDKEIMARVEAEQKAAPVAAPEAAKAPAKSISEAARIITDVAKTQVPKDDVGKLYDDIEKKLNGAPRPETEAFTRMVEKAEKRAEDIKARGVSEALMKFGFGMAASAAIPGQARRSGIAGALESAAAASPILAESVAENQKLQAAAEDNAFKLRMEQARYQSALEQGNKQLAASLAGSISQRNLQQAQLEEQIAQNTRANALKEKELAGLAPTREIPKAPLKLHAMGRHEIRDLPVERRGGEIDRIAPGLCPEVFRVVHARHPRAGPRLAVIVLA